MLYGKYSHVLDSKGRLTIPSKYRKELGKKLIISKGYDSDIFILRSEEKFHEFVNSLENLPDTLAMARTVKRQIFASTIDLETDSHGRINIPNSVLSENKIDKEITLVGMGDHCEIWPTNLINAHLEASKPKCSEFVEKLSSDIEISPEESIKEIESIKTAQNNIILVKNKTNDNDIFNNKEINNINNENNLQKKLEKIINIFESLKLEIDLLTEKIKEQSSEKEEA